MDYRRTPHAAGQRAALHRPALGAARSRVPGRRQDGPRGLARSRRQRAAVRQHAGRLRRRWWRLRPRSGDPARTGPRQHVRLGWRPALGDRCTLLVALWQRRTKAALAAEDGNRRADRRHRDDRARHRQRLAGGAHQRAARSVGFGPALPAQRRQDVHHQRPERQPDRRRLQDRRRGGRQGYFFIDGRDRAGAGLSPGPPPGQDRHEGPGHVGAVLRRRAGARQQPDWRPARAGLFPADGAAAAGAADHRRQRRRRDGTRARRDCSLRQGTQGLRQDAVGVSEHPLQTGRGAGHRVGRARFCRRLHGGAPEG